MEIKTGFNPLNSELKGRETFVATRRGLHHLPDHAEDHSAAGLQVTNVALGLGDVSLDSLQVFDDKIAHSDIIPETQSRYNS